MTQGAAPCHISLFMRMAWTYAHELLVSLCRVRTIVMKQALNEIDMRQHHTPAAVAMKLQLSQGLAFSTTLNQQGKIRVPFVANDLAATKAAHWDDLWSAQEMHVPS